MPTAPHVPQAPQHPPMTARLLAAVPAQAKGDGLWLTYTGGVVRTWIPGLNGDDEINLVIDLATLTAAGPTISALADHWMPVGTWSEVAISPAEILARLKLLDAPAESFGLPMFDRARELRLSMQQGLPWQASIGAKLGPDGRFELLTAPAMVNGQQIDLSPERPTYVLRGGVLTEQSIVLFGADDQTMRVAASATRLLHKEPTMSDDKQPTIKERREALVTKLGAQYRERLAVMLTDGCTDEEAVSKVKDEETAALKAQVADLTSKLEATNKTNAELTEKLAALTPAGGTGDNTGTPTGAADLTAPKTLMQAQLQAKDENGKQLRGFAALSWARAKYPHLAKPQPAA
jgi:hypothetical protein